MQQFHKYFPVNWRHDPKFFIYKEFIPSSMSTKRLKDQIIADILITCRGEGKTKTNIVYASGLNFNTILPYLISLSKNGLIEIIPGKYPLYKITPKGEDALIHLNALEELMPKYVTEDVTDLQSNGNAVSADNQNLELSQNGKNLVYISPLENEILNKIAPIYPKIQETSINEAKSRSLDYLKFKLMDLVESQEQVNWLDMGCGDGESLEALDGIKNINKIYYHGIDFAGDYLDKAEKRAKNMMLNIISKGEVRMNLLPKMNTISKPPFQCSTQWTHFIFPRF